MHEERSIRRRMYGLAGAISLITSIIACFSIGLAGNIYPVPSDPHLWLLRQAFVSCVLITLSCETMAVVLTLFLNAASVAKRRDTIAIVIITFVGYCCGIGAKWIAQIIQPIVYRYIYNLLVGMDWPLYIIALMGLLTIIPAAIALLFALLQSRQELPPQ